MSNSPTISSNYFTEKCLFPSLKYWFYIEPTSVDAKQCLNFTSVHNPSIRKQQNHPGPSAYYASEFILKIVSSHFPERMIHGEKLFFSNQNENYLIQENRCHLETRNQSKSCHQGISIFAAFFGRSTCADGIDRHFLHFEINGHIRKVSQKDVPVDSPALNKVILSVMRTRARL
ncbi:hypothetical protein CDAR_47421 [Caerostris darwini]|uniref:LAGLIDADG homing endonuclease n=1 Tax=Caerostris darwini TaxID=1538125 RepID=A0AAV4PGQ6_9ARAC|nr:hypothetical protein CDAR_47421 [Caerostris darwini]